MYHKELVSLAEESKLKTATTKTIVTALNVPDDVDVLFLLSVPNTLKTILLNSARLLIYTPSNEHFGIVPLEAMLAGVPVLAANTGGPLETVVDGETGWLCPPDDVEKWTSVMHKVLHEIPAKEISKMGRAGTERVKREFSDVKMAERLDGIVDSMTNMQRKGAQELSSFIWTLTLVLFDTAYFIASQNRTLNKKLENILLPPMLLTAVSAVSWVTYFLVGFSGQGRERWEPLT
jgi:alpha-1,3/alpha-1,6-mannosyltransferase